MLDISDDSSFTCPSFFFNLKRNVSLKLKKVICEQIKIVSTAVERFCAPNLAPRDCFLSANTLPFCIFRGRRHCVDCGGLARGPGCALQAKTKTGHQHDRRGAAQREIGGWIVLNVHARHYWGDYLQHEHCSATGKRQAGVEFRSDRTRVLQILRRAQDYSRRLLPSLLNGQNGVRTGDKGEIYIFGDILDEMRSSFSETESVVWGC